MFHGFQRVGMDEAVYVLRAFGTSRAVAKFELAEFIMKTETENKKKELRKIREEKLVEKQEEQEARKYAEAKLESMESRIEEESPWHDKDRAGKEFRMTEKY